MRKKLDPRIRILMANGQAAQTRGVCVVVGDRAREQVASLYALWQAIAQESKESVGKAEVLWCYEKELGFSSQQEKRRKEVRKRVRQGLYEKDSENQFENFLSKSELTFCYYKETQRVLGSTCDLLILQDFEALTPNILCQTIETVRGGGLIFFLLKNMRSLKTLYSLTMNVHSRFKTDAFPNITPLFNERLVLSMASSPAVLFLDDELNLLTVSQTTDTLAPLTPNSSALVALAQRAQSHTQLIASLKDNARVHALVALTKTLDQAKVLLLLLDAARDAGVKDAKEQALFVQAGRGRGKSAALGLAIAGALSGGCSSVFVSAATPENLKTVFGFVRVGLEGQGLQANLDFEVKSDGEGECVQLVLYSKREGEGVRAQRVTYLRPGQVPQAPGLVVIDEAAAIPIAQLRPMLFGCACPIFISSTVHGYEGTGRSLSLKLIEQLRRSCSTGTGVKQLREAELHDPIRYGPDDPVEQWLTSLLCLRATTPLPLTTSLPHPSACHLYFVNKETLFSYNRSSEAFLEKLWSLFVSSHYKNSPNDLQLLSDAPAHCLAVLLGPLDKSGPSGLPDVLVAVQICLEGRVRPSTCQANDARGVKPSGDLIPWTFSEQYLDREIFEELGARVVRIAVHKKAQRLGFGSRALTLLEEFFCEQKNSNPDSEEFAAFLQGGAKQAEGLAPKRSVQPLLKEPSRLASPGVSYLSVSFGMSREVFKFWTKNNYNTFYIRQKSNDITGEHSCMMIKPLAATRLNFEFFFNEYRQRFLALLRYDFTNIDLDIALTLLAPPLTSHPTPDTPAPSTDFTAFFSTHDIKRLVAYSANKLDHHIIKDLIPKLATLFFSRRFAPTARLSYSQALILLGYGLQNQPLSALATTLNLQHSQILALYNKAVRRLTKHIQRALTKSTEHQLGFDSNDPSAMLHALPHETHTLKPKRVKPNKQIKFIQFY